MFAPVVGNGNLTARGAYALNEMTNGPFGLPVCSHVKWQDLGSDLSYDRLTAADQPFSPERDCPFYGDERYTICNHFTDEPDAGRSRKCSGSHNFCCYDSESAAISPVVLRKALGPGLRCCLLHTQPCQDTDCGEHQDRHRVNLVRACGICATDMCISAQDIQSAGRIITMTIWKNLGGVHENQWATWYPHHKDIDAFLQLHARNGYKKAMIRDISKGTEVYTTFEKLPVPPTRQAATHWYTPVLSRGAMEVFKGEPKPTDGAWFARIPVFKNYDRWGM